MIKKILGCIYIVVGGLFALSSVISNSGGICVLGIGIVLIIYGAVNVFSK
jgi:hypothetical protein